MILKAFSIYDVKSDSYATPFFMPATGMAVRAFTDLVNDANTTVHRHPGDYKLCEVGTFDDATGEFQSVGPLSLGFGSDYVGPGNVVPLGVKAG